MDRRRLLPLLLGTLLLIVGSACRPPLAATAVEGEETGSSETTQPSFQDTLDISVFTPPVDETGVVLTEAVSLKVSGSVTDLELGVPVPGADVFIRIGSDLRATTQTDAQGIFCTDVAIEPLKTVNLVIKASKGNLFGETDLPVHQASVNLANIRTNTDPTPEVASDTIHRTCANGNPLVCVQNAVDGLDQTEFRAANVVNTQIPGCPTPPGGERWYRINFGRLVELHAVHIAWGEPCFGTNYAVLTTTEETPPCPAREDPSWETVASVPDDAIPNTGDGGLDAISLVTDGEGKEARWLSLIFVSPGDSGEGEGCTETGPQFVIQELKVYGTRDLSTDSCR